MNDSVTNEAKNNIVKKFKMVLKNDLLAIVLTGSVSNDTYRPNWSDLDFLIIVERHSFDIKRAIAEVINDLENSSGIHHGFNVIDAVEFHKPIVPDVSLDGKTLQALIGLMKHPQRIIYSKYQIDLNKVYSPNTEIIKGYSLSNIGMFLRRNRQTLTRILDITIDDLKELLKKEIRAAFIITKLAVQYSTGTAQDSYEDSLRQAMILYPDVDFSVLSTNFTVIARWQNINDKSEIMDIFRSTDSFIESFSRCIFENAKR